MIAVLHFGSSKNVGASRLQKPRFIERSTLPLQAACLVANGACEQLKKMLARDVELDLFGPMIPDAAAQTVLFADALVYRVRGRQCDVFISLRKTDAHHLSAMIFGEAERSEEDPLSDVERATLERVLTAMAPLCAPLCGQLGSVHPISASRATVESVTYFEIRIAGTMIAIGFSLSKDPPEEITRNIRLDDLLDVPLTGHISCAEGDVAFPVLNALDCGAVLPLRTGLDEKGFLRFGNVRFINGTCGSQGKHAAFIVGSA